MGRAEGRGEDQQVGDGLQPQDGAAHGGGETGCLQTDVCKELYEG